ncbi:hypothetical protein ACIQVK_18670 [Streptomyces sp. NPDC090493]|uniref:hypothetical protein n=1 Tax=Streptomyces sp. NPDC090493 TaxID=3365964 RepID=UPI0038294FEF
MPETIRRHAAGLGLNDGDVAFPGGQDDADLLLPTVPHLYAPLTGGMSDHRAQCAQTREDADMCEA